MRLIKRLDFFILKSFLPLFAMTFFIVLFIVLMQFLWKYIDDLVGKGLGVGVLSELFFYAAVSMVPMALPLAILLASLMTFGNFGEKFELTAMKASGVSLVRAMAPVTWLVALISIGAFFFQNDVLPHAQVKMWTLLFSMRQKSPELEIPEGVFYDQIPGYNLFVKSKDKETGMLHNVMIYDVSSAGDNSTILLADSSRLAFTPDSRYLYLHLFQGEQFENLREQNTNDRNVPFRRETFFEKEVLIPFDNNFNRLDEGGMRNQYVGKNISQLRHTIDSVQNRVDSMGAGYSRDLSYSAMRMLPPEQNSFTYPQASSQDLSEIGSHSPSAGISPSIHAPSRNVPADGASDKPKSDPTENVAPVSIDSLLLSLDTPKFTMAMESARGNVERQITENEYKAMAMDDEKRTIRRHAIELIKKFTLSVACIIFFFIGAPLGAIIRKGGLGTPLVISVFLFLFYYIVDNTGYKMARDGRWPVWCGMWLSTAVLAPLGVYVTWKAMNDSSVFDKDRYLNLLRRLIGRKADRSVRYKEVIINELPIAEAQTLLSRLATDALLLARQCRLRENWKSAFLNGPDRNSILDFSDFLDSSIEQLTDTRCPLAVNKLVDFPVIGWRFLMQPAKRKWEINLLRWVLPIGLPIWYARKAAIKSLRKDLDKTAATALKVSALLDRYGNNHD